MKEDCKFWNGFINARLQPTSNVSQVYMERARILYQFMRGNVINVGDMIFKEMHGTLTKYRKALKFPSLIIEMCIAKGVPILPNEDYSIPAPTFGLHQEGERSYIFGLCFIIFISQHASTISTTNGRAPIWFGGC